MTTKNRLYLLVAPETETDRYDVVQAFVVRAPSPKRAREIAAKNASDEGARVWLGGATCKVLRAAGQPGVVLCDFRAG